MAAKKTDTADAIAADIEALGQPLGDPEPEPEIYSDDSYDKEALILASAVRFDISPEVARAAATDLPDRVTVNELEAAIQAFLARPARPPRTA